MRNPLFYLTFLCIGVTASPAFAAGDCAPREEVACEMRKHPSCGPVQLNFRSRSDGPSQCDSGFVTLNQVDIYPHLRRVRCFFYGDSSRLKFDGTNYIAKEGPDVGDVLELHDGTLSVTLFGHYRSMSEVSRVRFENLGPGASVIMKCSGFGPA